jgi:large subunit ribosomal protein L4
MSKAVVLNEKFQNSGELALPASYDEINSHNLYLYVKSYLSALRANTARAKTRAEVSGGGKKPKAQKGSGGARWGSKDHHYLLAVDKRLDQQKEITFKKSIKSKKR